MVEFALVAPLGFILVLGIVVVAIVATNQNRMTNSARDAARAAAVCGSNAAPTTLPNGRNCSDTEATSYATAQLKQVDTSYPWGPALSVIDQSGASDGSSLSNCKPGRLVLVTATYQQPLFVPFMGVLVGNAATNTRTLQARAEATCEQ
ncbi:MAG: pilus assembly protein [Candidatus Dormibacteraeota bacterium]|nr:pilus assembly protein [Candidatus Dormibacteraeota bacterium]